MHFPTARKKSIFRILYRPSLGRVFAALFKDQVPCRGCVIDTSDKVIVPRIKAKLFLRGYEYEEISFVKRYLRRDLDAIDLGSNLGVVAAHIARKLSTSRRLICVEANPALLASIRTNVCRNAPHAKLAVVHGAIEYPPDHRTSVKLAIGFDNLVSKVVENGTASETIPVPAITLSQILNEYGINDYSLVSDIEGSEAGLVEEGGEALARCQQLIIELHETTRNGRRVAIEQLRKTLEDGHGFKMRDWRGLVYVFER